MKTLKTLNLILTIVLLSINCIYAGIGDYEIHKISASDGANYTYFGSQGSVAIDGDYAVVGSYLADVNGINNAGAAYIYFWNGTNWIEQAKIYASNLAEEQHFGKSVAINGDRVVVGAIGTYSTNSLGQAYVFKRNESNWLEEAILTASDGVNRDAFGTDVEILNDEIIISANDQYSYKGAVYCFKFDGSSWVESQIISPTSSAGYKQFGKSLVFDESNLLVGCIDDSYSGFRMPGAVYAFAKEGGIWVQKSRILPDDNTIRVSFGTSVVLQNDVAVISDVDSTPEKVYIFNKTDDTTWVQIDTLKSGSITHDMFGYDLGIDGEYILIGSQENSEASYEAGSVFVYKNNGNSWLFDENILPQGSEFMGEFGNGIACKDGRIIIGASLTTGFTSESGAAFIYMSPILTPGVITSTTNGGLWHEASTWIGGVIPTSTDDVIIDGTVKYNSPWPASISLECMNITINSGDSLFCDDFGPYGVILKIGGDIINNGTISQDGSYFHSIITVMGNITNYGDFSNVTLWMQSDLDQSITSTNQIEVYEIEMKNGQNLIAGSDLTFIDTYLQFNNGEFIIADDKTVSFYSTGGGLGNGHGHIDKAHITGGGTIFSSGLNSTSNVFWFNDSTTVENIMLTGNIRGKGSFTILGGVVNKDTLQQAEHNYPVTIYMNEDFTNDGVIRDNPNDNDYLELSVKKNIINNGDWKNAWVIMDGITDQTFTNNGTLNSSFKIKANVTSATTYQWYKDGVAIDGAAEEYYVISKYNEPDYGEFYCQTNAGNSRAISIIDNSSSGGEIISENFDGTQFPPNGWSQTIVNSSNTWKSGNPAENSFNFVDGTNVNSAICPWVAADQNEWLKTPILSFPNDAISLEFYAGYSTSWLNAATIKLNISTDGGTNWTKIWEAENDGNGWQWRKTAIDLSSYSNNSNVVLGWQYIGNDGDLAGIDNIKITYGTVDVKENNLTQIPSDFSLSQNYPNPFNPSTTISYQIPEKCFVNLKVYDILGNEVITLVNGQKQAGSYQINFDASNLSSGVYVYQIIADKFVKSKKMLLLK